MDSMMIDDIPKSSLNSQDVVFEVQESSSELLSIQVAQIQAISEFKGKERISLRVEPVILDLNWYRLRVDSCIEETVDFVNGSPCPALVTWVPGGGSVVRVEPERFEVTDRTTVRVSVKPQCAGRMHETLRFRAENRDGVVAETEMYVRGTVERKPELCVRSPALAQLGAVYVGRPVSYPVDLMLANTGTDAKPFHVYKQMYDFEGDCSGSWNLRSRDAVCYGPYSTGSDVAGGADGPATLRLETPVNTEVTAVGLSCQLAEWSLAESTEPAAVAFTQSVTYAVLPDVRLNVNAVTVAECLYKSVSHSHREIRLVNNTPYELVYSWGNPMGSDADNVDCTFKPANGTVDGDAFVEFEFIVTPKTSGHFDECYIPCFVQCEAVPPQQFCFRWRAEGFSATIVYADECSGQYTVTWVDDKNQWIVDRESSIDIDEAEGNYSENEDNLTSITNTWSNSGDMENLQEDDIE